MQITMEQAEEKALNEALYHCATGQGGVRLAIKENAIEWAENHWLDFIEDKHKHLFEGK